MSARLITSQASPAATACTEYVRTLPSPPTRPGRSTSRTAQRARRSSPSRAAPAVRSAASIPFTFPTEAPGTSGALKIWVTFTSASTQDQWSNYVLAGYGPDNPAPSGPTRLDNDLDPGVGFDVPVNVPLTVTATGGRVAAGSAAWQDVFDWGDGSPADYVDVTAPAAGDQPVVSKQHVYTQPGTYQIYVSVFDGVNQSAPYSIDIKVSADAAKFTATPTEGKGSPESPFVVTLDGTASTAGAGAALTATSFDFSCDLPRRQGGSGAGRDRQGDLYLHRARHLHARADPDRQPRQRQPRAQRVRHRRRRAQPAEPEPVRGRPRIGAAHRLRGPERRPDRPVGEPCERHLQGRLGRRPCRLLHRRHAAREQAPDPPVRRRQPLHGHPDRERRTRPVRLPATAVRAGGDHHAAARPDTRLSRGGYRPLRHRRPGLPWAVGGRHRHQRARVSAP